VVLTRGSSGARAFTATGFVDVAAPSVVVADAVGAGDSFMAALLHALCGAPATGDLRTRLREVDDASVAAAVTYACAAAALTVSRPGADPPTDVEVSAFLRRNQPGLAP
jgi:fructokinase